jgi:hypothetical protein
LTSLWVAGVGIIAPGLPDWSIAAAVFRGQQPWQATEAAVPAVSMLPKNERRRASQTIRFALEAAQQAIAASGFAPTELATVFGSSSGEGDVLDAILEVVTGAQPRVSPTLFHNSVHNAAAGYANIATGSRAPSLSIGAFDETVAATLLAGAVQARRGPVLVCVYDTALPPTLRDVRDVSMSFAAALVLCPERPAAPVARTAVNIAARSLPESAMRQSDLAALVRANPAARVLPLLEAIARREAAEIVLSWEDSPSLEITVLPC